MSSDAMTCRLCGAPCDETKDYVVALDETATHVMCLEDAGLWNAQPEGLT